MYSNVDTLNKDKLIELCSRLGQEKVDIIMMEEGKPKYYKRKLGAIQYHIQGYEMIQKMLNQTQAEVYEYRGVKCETQFEEYIAVEIKDKDYELYVFVNIYRSPNSTDDNSLKLHNLLLEVSEKKKYNTKFCVVTLIIKNMYSLSKQSRIFLPRSNKKCILTQHIDRPTRVRVPDKPSTLDLLLTDQEANIAEIQMDSPLGISDHALISATLFCYFPVPNRTWISYQYDKANFDEMKKILMIDWKTVLNDCNLDINKMWEIFLNKMKEVENMIKLWERYCKTSDGKIYLEYCKARKIRSEVLPEKHRNCSKSK